MMERVLERPYMPAVLTAAVIGAGLLLAYL